MRTKKKFDIERVREFCKLINEGNTPNRALIIMRSSNGYITPLKKAGIYWKEKDGTFRAVERVRVERYELFEKEKINYNWHSFYNYFNCCIVLFLWNLGC